MQRAMIWHHPLEDEGRILVEGSVIDLVSHYRQLEMKTPEAGGILLGYRRGIHLHIVSATFPQLNDRRARHRFHRIDPFHQSVATRYWKESGGTIDYIGEWHTHPENEPIPSSLDIAEWQKICRYRNLPMVFVILGWSDEIWLGVGSNQGVTRGKVCSEINEFSIANKIK